MLSAMDIQRALPTVVLMGVGAVLLAPLVLTARMLTGGTPRDPTIQSKGEAGTTRKATAFDGERAYRYLIEQCELGPRLSGSAANKKLQARLLEHFRAQGGQAEAQAFSAPHPVSGADVEMANIIGSWHADRSRRLLICAHFDTRPVADEEPNPKVRAKTFLGANDGASGVAVLMELAHLLPDLSTAFGVDLVAFDGEELVYRSPRGTSDTGDYFLGSIHFAQQYAKQTDGKKYVAAILLDMVGGRSLQLHPDQVSWEQSQALVQEVWAVARRLRASGFRQPPRPKHDIRDDHLPLLEAGIPAIDLIDFDYPHWHRVGDTADKCSASSLAQVGNVLVEWLKTKK
jgi:hypothetical protein